LHDHLIISTTLSTPILFICIEKEEEESFNISHDSAGNQTKKEVTLIFMTDEER
jgi:hypothetical protein